MALGPWMKLTTDAGLDIELGPFERHDTLQFVRGFQSYSLLKYLGVEAHAQTEVTEQEWYDGMVKKKTDLTWGIWVIKGQQRVLVGSTSLKDIGSHEPTERNITQATTGISITNQQYWGKGIASATHRARTWYAFRHLGIVRLKSAVAQPNTASSRAVEKVGYSYTYTERNKLFVNGNYVHMDNYECLNPDDWSWRLWWGTDRPSLKALDARRQTRQALDWADQHVTLL